MNLLHSVCLRILETITYAESIPSTTFKTVTVIAGQSADLNCELQDLENETVSIKLPEISSKFGI